MTDKDFIIDQISIMEQDDFSVLQSIKAHRINDDRKFITFFKISNELIDDCDFDKDQFYQDILSDAWNHLNDGS